MEKKAKILMSKELVDEYLLKPSEESIKRNNIHAQMYRYLMKNSLKFTIPDSPTEFFRFDATVRPIQAGEAVMFSYNYVSDAFCSSFCSWSDEGTLVQIFIFTDESSVMTLHLKYSLATRSAVVSPAPQLSRD